MKNHLEKIANINKKLKSKGFDWDEIEEFWIRMFQLAPQINETTLKDIKVCTGCGTLNIEEIKAPSLSCCPDSSYINIDLNNDFYLVELECIGCDEFFDMETMQEDSVGERYCQKCWDELSPIMQAEYEELKAKGEIE